MSISGIGSAASGYVNGMASDGDSAAVEAKESAAKQLAEKLNGGTAPKTASTSSGQQSDLVKLRKFASEDMPVSQIAERLGKTVSNVMLEAQAAGINITTGNSSQPTSGNPAIGNIVNTTI